MRSWGLTIELKSLEAAETYRKLHVNQIPEIDAPGGALDVIGVKTMQIFYMPPRSLFMYMETTDEFIPSVNFSRALTLNPKVKAFDDYVHGELLRRVEANTGPTEWGLMERLYKYDQRADAVF